MVGLYRYKHLRVSDFSDSTATLPPEELQQFFPGHEAAPALPATVMFDPDFQGKQLEDRTFLLNLQMFLTSISISISVRLTYTVCDSLFYRNPGYPPRDA